MFFDLLSDPAVQEKLLEEKLSGMNTRKSDAAELERYVHSGDFARDVQACRSGEYVFSPPIRISLKKANGGIRHVYRTDVRERLMMGLFVTMLRQEYDRFSDGLLSFRRGMRQQDVIERVNGFYRDGANFCCMTDVHNYSNSIDRDYICMRVEEFFAGEEETIAFFCRLLEQTDCLQKGELKHDAAAVKAGLPLSQFFTSLCLKFIDDELAARGVPFLRFGDNIWMFTETREEAEELCERVHALILSAKMEPNYGKAAIYSRDEPFSVFGADVLHGVASLADTTAGAVTGDIRHIAELYEDKVKTLGYRRDIALWMFIQKMNVYLYGGGNVKGISVPLFINCRDVEVLRKIDHNVQNIIRELGSGKKSPARYRISYETMRELGYRPLVSEYYKWRGNA